MTNFCIIYILMVVVCVCVCVAGGGGMRVTYDLQMDGSMYKLHGLGMQSRPSLAAR